MKHPCPTTHTVIHLDTLQVVTNHHLHQLECLKKRKGRVSCKENLSTDGIQVHKGFRFKLSKDKIDDKATANAADVIFNAWGECLKNNLPTIYHHHQLMTDCLTD
jgi:hypothetical protein